VVRWPGKIKAGTISNEIVQHHDRFPTFLADAKADEPLLSAPEIYEAVQRMRPVPLGKSAILAIAVPILIPFMGVLALQIPLKEVLQGLMKGLL
jgi:hypothetical protein